MRTFARGLSASNPEKWFENNRVNIPGVKEVIWEPLYDSAVYPLAGSTSIVFFQDQIGKNGKTLSDTNMELDGQLSKGKVFLITGIQIAFYPGNGSNSLGTGMGQTLVRDVEAFSKGGALILRIQSKEYLRQAPLGKFPPCERISGDATVYGQNVVPSTTQYAVTSGREFAVRQMLLESNQNFTVELVSLPALPSGLNGRLVVTLNGYTARNAQ